MPLITTLYYCCFYHYTEPEVSLSLNQLDRTTVTSTAVSLNLFFLFSGDLQQSSEHSSDLQGETNPKLWPQIIVNYWPVITGHGELLTSDHSKLLTCDLRSQRSSTLWRHWRRGRSWRHGQMWTLCSPAGTGLASPGRNHHSASNESLTSCRRTLRPHRWRGGACLHVELLIDWCVIDRCLIDRCLIDRYYRTMWRWLMMQMSGSHWLRNINVMTSSSTWDLFMFTFITLSDWMSLAVWNWRLLLWWYHDCCVSGPIRRTETWRTGRCW